MESSFQIDTFSGGINEFTPEALMSPKEAVTAKNFLIDNGALTTETEPDILGYLSSATNDITKLISFYVGNEEKVLAQVKEKIYNSDGTLFTTIPNSGTLDYVNFQYKGENVLIFCNGNNPRMIKSDGTVSVLKNRRIEYAEDGSIYKYVTPEGYKYDRESSVTSVAPASNLIELYQDRLWLVNYSSLYQTERIFFSTSGVNGADIEDFTFPIEEGEANQHGGFIDVRSYDGSSIIGLKTAFDSLYVFKQKSIFKIVGSSTDNFQLVQVAESSGTIADRSIAVGNNGIYYMSQDGIYYFDGTNTHRISDKIKKTLEGIDKYRIDEVIGCFYNGKYYLSIPYGGYFDTKGRIIEYDVNNDSFMFHDYLTFIKDIANINGKLTTASGKFIEIPSDTDYHYTLDSYWESPFYDFGSQNSKKSTTYLYFRGYSMGTKNKVEFELISDKGTKKIQVTLDGYDKIYKVKLKNKGRYFKICISNVDHSFFEIKNLQLVAEIDVD